MYISFLIHFAIHKNKNIFFFFFMVSMFELLKPEALPLSIALSAVIVGSSTTVVFPWAIGKLMDCMNASNSKTSMFGVESASMSEKTKSSTISPNEDSLSDVQLTSESLEALLPTWLYDLIPLGTDPLLIISGGLIGVFTIGSVATTVRNTAVHTAGERIASRLRKRVFRAIMARETAFFDRSSTGDLLNRLSVDVTQVSKTLSEDTSYFLRNFAQGLGAIGMMLYTSPQLCMVMMGVIPPVAAWGVFFGRKVRAKSKEYMDSLANAGTIAKERLGDVKTVRALGNDDVEVLRYHHSINEAYKVGKNQAFLQGIFYGVAMGSGNFGMVAVLYYGGHYVQEGLISVGDLSSMLLYSVYAGFSISALLSYYGDVNKALGSSKKIFELLEEGENKVKKDERIVEGERLHVVDAPREKAIDVNGQETASDHSWSSKEMSFQENNNNTIDCSPADVIGPISIQNLSFAYPSRPQDPIFDGLSLDIDKGETVALVGPSGSGKSSLASILMRMYNPRGGDIFLNNKNLKSFSPRLLRSNISYVPQDAVLFSGSIKENLFYGFGDLGNQLPSTDPSIGLNIFPIVEAPEKFNLEKLSNTNFETQSSFLEEKYNKIPGKLMEDNTRLQQIYEACKVANCYDFIMELDEGFDTNIGERGAQLSGGQRARICLARSIIRDSNILILDEISAALDSSSEHQLHTALINVLQGRTTLLIAHRWSSIQIADKVAVLGDGKIIEQGTHSDLLSSHNSAFRKLVQHQLK